MRAALKTFHTGDNPMPEPAEYLCYKTTTPEETRRFGEALGQVLEPGDLLALVGGLGAGKTCLSQGILAGIGVKGPVSSPTFTIVNEYQGRLPVYHLDVYRLEDPTELEDLGYEELFYGDGVTVIEWADKVEELLPREHLRIELVAPGRESPTCGPEEENTRRITLLPRGERGHRILRALAEYPAGISVCHSAEGSAGLPNPESFPPDFHGGQESGGGA